MDLPFAFSSTGDGFIFHDNTAAPGPMETSLPLAEFLTPATLWVAHASKFSLVNPPPDLFDGLFLNE